MLLLAALAGLRPYLYHLTSAENLSNIRSTRRLLAARRLMEAAGRTDLDRTRRSAHTPLALGDAHVILRDQAPLHAGNAQLAAGWSMDDLIADLNGRVFFWPGTAAGPSAYGQRHFGRYAAERPVLLRINTAALAAANPGVEPEYSRYNSGSPRWTYGRASPRGPDTFIPALQWVQGVARVVEVTFVSEVILPSATGVGRSITGPWRSL